MACYIWYKEAKKVTILKCPDVTWKWVSVFRPRWSLPLVLCSTLIRYKNRSKCLLTIYYADKRNRGAMGRYLTGFVYTMSPYSLYIPKLTTDLYMALISSNSVEETTAEGLWDMLLVCNCCAWYINVYFSTSFVDVLLVNEVSVHICQVVFFTSVRALPTLSACKTLRFGTIFLNVFSLVRNFASLEIFWMLHFLPAAALVRSTDYGACRICCHGDRHARGMTVANHYTRKSDWMFWL